MSDTPRKSSTGGRPGCLGWLGILLLGLVELGFLLAGAALAGGPWAQASLKAAHPPIGQMVDIGGYRMHIYCLGQGEPTVILDAPLVAPGLMWSHLQPTLAETTRTCIYDRAGIAWSEAGPQPRTAKRMVAELHALLGKAGIPGPYVLVGYSSSGLINRLYAYTYPGEVAGMVLADPSHEDQAERLGAEGSPWLMNVFRLGPALFRTRLPALFAGLIPLPGLEGVTPEAKRSIQALLAASPPFSETAYQELANIEMTFSELRAARSAGLGVIPLVVLSHGRMETIPGVRLSPEAEQVWQELQAEQASFSSQGRQVVVAESSHAIPFEHPELVVQAVQEVVQAAREQARK